MQTSSPPDPDAPAAPFDFFDLDDDHDAVATSHELSVTRSKLGDLLDLLPAGLLIHQHQGVVYANFEASRILAQSGDALVGRHFLDFVEDADVEAQGGFFRSCFDHHTLVRSKDCTVIGADGRRTSVQISMSPLPWEGLPVIYVLLTDVTAMKETQERLHRLSITDPLTGAYNRRHFIDEAEREAERARRYGHAMSLLAIDIDHFKRVNDSHGHAAGDEALKAFTTTCRQELRTADVLGRLGGEEFAILLPETDEAGARRMAERIRLRMSELEIPAGPATVRFTVSIGVSSCRAGTCGVDAILSRADEALYRAKHAGRNRVVAHDDVVLPA